MRSYAYGAFFNAKTRVLSFPSGRRHAKKFRLASLGFNVREARPFLGLCPANAPRRPSGVDQRKAFGILKGAHSAHFPCSRRQIMGKRPPCFNSARGEYYTITLYFFIIIRYKKDDVFGLPLLNGLVYM